MDFSKHPGMLRALSSPQSNVKGIVTGSQLSDTFGTTYEGPDALDKSMDPIEIDDIKEDMISDQTAVLGKTTIVTTKCIEARDIEIPLQQGSSSQEKNSKIDGKGR